MSLRVSTCCGEPLEVEGSQFEFGTRYFVCQKCHEPNDGESIAERDMRIAEKAAEIGARGVLERVSFDDDKGVVYLDERSGQWKRLSNIDLATDSIVRALDLGAITGRKV